MKTTKERLATAIHTSLNETLSFYKTSLTGLTEEQVEKNRDLYGENTIPGAAHSTGAAAEGAVCG